ncbi:MAG: hypothetical protein ACI4ND_05055, partial [Succinivibrio sp.]
MKNWNSTSSLLSYIASENYLILRGRSSVCENFSESSDWDILCKDKELFVNKIGAESLVTGEYCFNYVARVSGKKLYLDIRTIGDGYYDAVWQERMLQNRVEYQNFYILNENDFYYSILYHALIHKKTIPSKYQKIFSSLDDFSESSLIKQLADYMKKNKYCVS